MACTTDVQAVLDSAGISSVEDVDLDTLLLKLGTSFSQSVITHTSFSWLQARLEAVHIDRKDIFVREVADWARTMKNHGFAADQLGADLDSWTRQQATIDPTCVRKLEYLGREIQKRISGADAIGGDSSPSSAASDEGMVEENGDANSEFPAFLTGANMPLEKIKKEFPEGFLKKTPKQVEKLSKPKGLNRPPGPSRPSEPIHPSGPNRPPADYVCHNCGISGHWIRNCPKVYRGYVCEYCGGGGHWSSQCLQRPKPSSTKTQSKCDQVDHQRFQRQDHRKGHADGSRQVHKQSSSTRQARDKDPFRLKGPFHDDFDANDEGEGRKQSKNRSRPREVSLEIKRDAKVEGRLSFHEPAKWEDEIGTAVTSKRRHSPNHQHEANSPPIVRRKTESENFNMEKIGTPGFGTSVFGGTEDIYKSGDESFMMTKGQDLVVISDNEEDSPEGRAAKRQRPLDDDFELRNGPFTAESSPATSVSELSRSIELGIDIKPFDNRNLFMQSLFQNRPNVWIQRVKRRTALDMWDARETSDKAKGQDVAASMNGLELDDKDAFHFDLMDVMGSDDETHRTRNWAIDLTQDYVVDLTGSDDQNDSFYSPVSQSEDEYQDASMEVDG